MKKIIKLCLLAIAFIPLIIDNSVFFGAITGKSFFLRFIVALVSILFLSYFFYNKKFRDRVNEKVNLIIKNPIFISVLVFFFLYIISTIFAIDKYTAFWGDLQRGEGLVGMLYFFAFFVFTLIIFEKDDFLWFFKLSLFTSIIILFREFWQFLGGASRPGSFLDNPAFLAGYLLFSIFCSIIVWNESINFPLIRGIKGVVSKNPLLYRRGQGEVSSNKFFKYFSICTFILSILGIFITQTRGTILGLVVGFIGVLLYFIFKKQGISLPKGEGDSLFFNLRKISIIILVCLVVFAGIFFATRKNEVWQKVPGFSRVAVMGEGDSTTSTRLFLAKLSMQAINPVQNGWKKFLIGWGPENFSLAYGKYFNPEQFNYELSWFDRAHNKFLDVLVMNGLFGILAYSAIFFFFFRFLFKRVVSQNPFLRRGQGEVARLALLFFGISMLVHLFFIFDQPTTYIALFIMIAFTILFAENNLEKEQENKNIKQIYQISKLKINIFASGLAILGIFICFVFFRNDLIGYIQMRNYYSLIKESDSSVILKKIDSVFIPFTSAQMNIRKDFLSFVVKDYDIKNKDSVALFSKGILKAEEYIEKNQFDLRFLINLAVAYSSNGTELKDFNSLNKGEIYLKKAISIIGEKPDFNYDLAINLISQKKFGEAFPYFEKVFSNKDSLFLKDQKGVNDIYPLFIAYFYQTKDKENFIKTANRLKENNYSDSIVLQNIINFIEKTKTWPHISFQ